METIKTFLTQVVAKDAEIQAKINSASPVEIVQIAATAGYQFTEEALTNFFNSLSLDGDRELSNVDLQAVAGGQKCHITAAYSSKATSAGVTKCCGDH